MSRIHRSNETVMSKQFHTKAVRTWRRNDFLNYEK